MFARKTAMVTVRRSRLGTSGVALLLSVSLAACGSTLEETGSDSAASGGGRALDSVGTAAQQGAGAVPDANGDGVITAEDQAAARVGAGAGTVGAVAGGTTGSAGSAGVGGSAGVSGSGTGSGTGSGPARVTKPLKLGMIIIDNQAIAAAFGAQGTDPTKPTNDFIEYMNKTGGVAGRKIEPNYYRVDGSKDANTASQESCEQWKDAKVELVLATGSSDVGTACLARAGIMVIDYNLLIGDKVEASKFRNRVLPTAMGIDRLHGGSLRISAQRGIIKRGDKLGIIREDCPSTQRTQQNVIMPLAQELGVTVVQGTHRCVQGLQDTGPVTQDVQREALRFSGERVTHVMFLSVAEAFVLSRFTQTASQQQYFPKYLVTSHAYPYTNSREGATIAISRDALPNITGVGYLQMFDVGDNDTPPAAQVAERARCKKAEPTELGSAKQTNNQKYFLRQAFWALCDGMFTLRAVMEATGGSTSIDAVNAGYQKALGGRKKVSAGLSGGFHEVTPDRRDAAGLLRPYAWDAKKNSFVYVAAAVAVP